MRGPDGPDDGQAQPGAVARAGSFLHPAERLEQRRVEERTSVRDGTGLGLAIVRSIGTAHGASVDAHSLPDGGLRILVTLPLADEGGADSAAPAP